jgi:hypothetical protein
MKIGGKILDEIDTAIRLRDKVLLILSEHSIKSDWVEDEVSKAFAEDRKRAETLLFPVRLDNAVIDTSEAWAVSYAISGISAISGAGKITTGTRRASSAFCAISNAPPIWKIDYGTAVSRRCHAHRMPVQPELIETPSFHAGTFPTRIDHWTDVAPYSGADPVLSVGKNRNGSTGAEFKSISK